VLIISRRLNQAVVIGNVTVTLVDIRCGQARLGFTAPRDVKIMRTELLNRTRTTPPAPTLEAKP
jgi:carbon storage regulator